jgi:hypothetical protein
MILIHPYWQSCPTNLTGATAQAIGATGTNNSGIPYYGFYNYGWTAWILTPAEIGSAKQISAIGIWNTGYTVPYTFSNQTVKMAHVSQNNFGGTSTNINLSNLTISDLKVVRSLHNFTIVSGQQNTWYKHTLDSNFCYNGTSNLLIIWEDRDGLADYIGVGTHQTITGPTQGAFKFSDVSFPSGTATVISTKPRTLIYS